MRTRWALITLVIVVVALSACAASADPWPDLSGKTQVSYVQVVPVFNASTMTWTFQVTVSPTANIVGVKGLAIYQLDGALAPLEPYSSGPTGWTTDGGYITNEQAFGWLGDGPTSYIEPGESDTTNFWASWSGTAPAAGDFTYLVHIVPNAPCETFWAQPNGINPEPASILLLGLGGLGLAGLRRRKR